MKKFFTYLNRIPKDKWMHFCAGFVIAPWPYLLVNALVGFWAGLLASFVVLVAAAKGKEIYNSRNGGLFDWMDFFAIIAGGVLYWLPLMVSLKIGV